MPKGEKVINTPAKYRSVTGSIIGELPRFLLILALALAPLPLGSNRDWAWYPLALIVAAVLICGAVAQARKSVRSPEFSVELAIAFAAMSTAIAWAVLQTISFDFLGSTYALRLSSTSDLPPSPAHPIALDTEEAIGGLTRLLSYCAAFWSALLLCQSVTFARRAVWTVVASACLVTVYGLVMQADNGSCIVINIVKAPIGSSCAFSGTFRNSSNYATFAGLAALVCLAELQHRFLRIDSSSTNLNQRIRDRLAILGGSGGIVVAALVLLVIGLLLSGSKAAATSFAVAAAVTIVLQNATRRRSLVSTLLTLAIATAILLVLASIGGEMLFIRAFQFLEAGDGDRKGIYAIAIRAIELRPLAGWGLGSFPSVFHLLAPPSVLGVYDKAHNTYLELAVELGLPAASLMLVANLIVVRRCLAGAFTRSRDQQYCVMAVGASTLVGLHSFFDFSIQIPAVALAYSVVLGAGWAQSRSSRL